MKALVTGGRGRTKRKTVNATLTHYAPTTIIVAEPAGPAAFAAEWAEKHCVPVYREELDGGAPDGPVLRHADCDLGHDALDEPHHVAGLRGPQARIDHLPHEVFQCRILIQPGAITVGRDTGGK